MQLCAKVNAKMVKTLSCSLAFAFAMAIAATLHGTADSYSFRGHYTTPTADSDASCSVNNRQDCYPWAYQDGGVSPKECGAHGCCYDSTNSGEPWCFYPSVPAPSKQQCSLNNANRVDCFPDGDASEGECNARGCCWVPVQDSDNLPWCFYPRVDGYSVENSRNVNNGFTANLTWSGEQRGPFGNDPEKVRLDVWEDSDTRLHFKFTEPGEKRFEVPGIVNSFRPSSKPDNPQYKYKLNNSPFGIEITDANGDLVFFNSTPPSESSFSSLIFERQYMEISSQIPSTAKVYGLGEHVTPLELPRKASADAGQVFTIFAKDQATPPHQEEGGTNLYGSHPFYMVYDVDHEQAYGVFLLNANGMDVVLQGNAVTFRVIGGILDFYVFTGPSPGDVIQQYVELIGHPIMPPYWGLGYNLCRWGYGSIGGTEQVTDEMRQHSIPQDTQWNDIDYMDQHLDFTTDPENFPVSNFSAFVDKLHNRGQRYVMIFDPAISSTQKPGTYPAFDDGKKQGVFINDSDGNIFIGKVWPGLTAFPDFFNPKTYDWWLSQIKAFHEKIAFDGMWIDMNEPSNFCAGECPSDQSTPWRRMEDKTNFNDIEEGFDPNHPPYLPGRRGGVSDINEKTVAMDAVQYPGLHYDFHNMYGHSEAVASNKAMETILGERSLVIGRSTFPGSGVHEGHWLGDNRATWEDLYYSIPGTITMNMFGIPLVGPDICGFNGDTNAELCTRWTQLGAFYGFMRNHNTKGAKPQAPYQFGEPYTGYMRTAIETRYTLLPYIYTLFKEAHVSGTPVNRALFWEFHTSEDGDISTLASVDTQMMLGGALLVTPALKEGDTSVTGYFPKATWYDWFSGAQIVGTVPGNITLEAPLDTINVHVRGGCIVPSQEHALDTTAARKNPLNLTVAFNSSGLASGSFFMDDGVSLDSLSNKKYTEITLEASCDDNGKSGSVTGTPLEANFSPDGNATWNHARILGMAQFPSSGTTYVNGEKTAHQYDESSGVLIVDLPEVPVTEKFTISWN